MHPIIEKIHSLIAAGAKVSTDTRQIEKDSVFFALKGENFDANNFALQAIEKGAQLAVVDNIDLPAHDQLIQVDDVLHTLQQVAAYHRSLFNIPVIGITGSNGKTTTKELINAVLSSSFNTLCTRGNFNNHIGVPLTLLNLNKHHQIAVIEMGANHMGEIALLSSLTQPTHGLITNIGKAHIEGFGSFENIIKGKTELYDYIKANKGLIFLNADNKILSERALPAECINYGGKPSYHYSGAVVSGSPFLEIEYFASGSGKTYSSSIKSQLPGAYNFENIMVAIAVGEHFKVPPSRIKEAIEKYIPNNSRSQLKDTGRNLLILDAYNANPTSMRAAIENFNAFITPLKKCLILGDMLELGDTTDEEHLEIIRFVSENTYHQVLLIGSNFKKISPAGEHMIFFDDTDQAAEWIQKENLHNLIILIKGSRGIKMEKLEQYL